MSAVKRATRNGMPVKFQIPGSKLYLTDETGIQLYNKVAKQFEGSKPMDNEDGKKRYLAFTSLLSTLKGEGRLWRTDGAPV